MFEVEEGKTSLWAYMWEEAGQSYSFIYLYVPIAHIINYTDLIQLLFS